jgi:hypothetical protein
MEIYVLIGLLVAHGGTCWEAARFIIRYQHTADMARRFKQAKPDAVEFYHTPKPIAARLYELQDAERRAAAEAARPGERIPF